MIRLAFLCLLLLPGGLALAQHDHRHANTYAYTLGERLEYRESTDSLFWDLGGRWGGDYHKFAWKTEGQYANGETDDAELELLYERAWTAFFDLQFGIRYADTETGGITSAVAGTQGLFPFRVESDLALFLSEDGDVTGRAEFEKDFFLAERMLIQPRAEIGVAFQDIAAQDIDAGLSKLSLGVRLRYELTRKFAPYIGIAWDKKFRGAAGDAEDTTALAGIRFWF